MGTSSPVFFLIYIVVFAVIEVIIYFKSRKTFFEINYAGGKIAFDISLYSKSEIDDFQKQLRRAKDLVIEKNIISDNSENSSRADEISKLFNLYEQGILSKEEFEHIKNKTLG